MLRSLDSRKLPWLIAAAAMVLLVCVWAKSAGAQAAASGSARAAVTDTARAAAAKPRPCSSYPAPGQLAPANAPVPKSIEAAYRLFKSRRTSADKLDLAKLESPLEASGIIRSGIRYLGKTAGGHHLYAVPARHFTRFKIAPLRCFPPAERSVERQLLPSLKRDYKRLAICIVETGVNTIYSFQLENCGPPQNIASAMIAVEGAPLIGLAPNAIRTVQATYMDQPARFIRVHRNFYELTGGPNAVTPCEVTWLQPSGNVDKGFEGCDYETVELPAYSGYQSFVTQQLGAVQSDVNDLATAVASGDLQTAESAWLTAHLAWLKLGQDDKQYGAFGNLGNEIDGTSAGLKGGTASPHFTGFHRIELDLWTDQNLSQAASAVATLQHLITQLIATPLSSELPVTNQGVANWLLRPHEILEDAERDTLTADDDYGSGTGAASIIADVTATREDLKLLNSVLKPLAPKLPARIGRALNAVQAAAAASRTNGQWTGIAQLSTAKREALDAAVGTAVELLSQVPDLLTSSGTSAPPT